MRIRPTISLANGLLGLSALIFVALGGACNGGTSAITGSGGAGTGAGSGAAGTGGEAGAGGTGAGGTGAGGAAGAGTGFGGGGGGTGGAATGGAAGEGTGGNAGGGTTGTAGHGATGGATAGASGRGGTGGTAVTGTGGGAGTAGAGASGTAGATATGTGGQTACPGATYDPSSPPATLTLTGNNLGAHDPAAYVLGSTIYLAATGLISKTSTNLTAWTGGVNPLPTPAWASTATGATNLWAPDISYFGGIYHLYYAASTFGSNKSCIGQATRAALDSGSWADQGMVLCSNMGETDNWNAIDPNVVIDDAGTPWLEFGSFWSGLKLVKLDPSTGLRADTMLYSIANHANGGIEGGWIFKRCGYYYLFSSWGACCSGAYDYTIHVGRSTAVTGPYVDMAGTQLMQNGGTLLVQGNASWVAPGHNAVITYNGKTYNIYHALKGSSSGQATLRISEIAWDANGWPVSGGP